VFRNVSDTWLLRPFMLYNIILMLVVRPGTSPSDIRAYTLDHHMQS